MLHSDLFPKFRCESELIPVEALSTESSSSLMRWLRLFAWAGRDVPFKIDWSKVGKSEKLVSVVGERRCYTNREARQIRRD